MKKINKKKGAAVVLTLSMVTGLTACGGTNTASGDVKKYYRAAYQENLPANYVNLSGAPKISGDTIFYAANSDDYTTYGIYSYNLTTQETHTYFEQKESEEYDPYAGGMSVNSYAVDDDGNIYLYAQTWSVDSSNIKEWTDASLDDVLNFMKENWGYTEDMAISEWNEYLEKNYIEQGFTNADGSVDFNKVMTEFDSWNLERIYTYSLLKYDAQGNEVYKNELTNEAEYTYSYVDSMVVGKDGTLYTFVNRYNDTSDEYAVDAYDTNGVLKGSCKLENYGNGLVPLADGSVGVLGWDTDYTNYLIHVIDPASMQISSEISFGSNYVESVVALDKENFLLSENGSLYTYNITTQEKKDYLNWVDCDISSNTVRGFQQLEDGRLVVATSTYDYSTYQELSELAIVEEIPAEEAANITSITLACLNPDETLEQRVIQTNKKNPQSRIHIKNFYQNIDEEEDYEDAMARFVTNIASDPEVDIVYFNTNKAYADMMNFASKGLLIDLSPFIESDAELNRDDFLSSILDACTYDSKLVGMPTGYAISTVIGKVSDVGTEPGWSFAEMKALLESKEPGTQLFYGQNREWALEMCLNLGYTQFIDLKNASCNFNTQEFVDVLEFANLFPETFEWTEGEDETILMNEGKVLLANYYLSDFEEIQIYTEIFGEELTYIGYPTVEGNGALLNVNNPFAITKNCEDTETAWKLIREYFLPQGENENHYYSYGMSIRQDDFDKFCEEAMKEEEGGHSWGNFEVEIKPATQKQVDEVKDLVANTTAVSGAVSNAIIDIINEEAAAYFNGQKSAEEVASIIQSRIQVYLSETN